MAASRLSPRAFPRLPGLGSGLLLLAALAAAEPQAEPKPPAGDAPAGNPRRDGRPRRERRPGLQEMFELYDANRDGRVTTDELNSPEMMLMLDQDRDGVLTRREVSESVTSLGASRRWARVDRDPTDAPPAEPLAEAVRPVSHLPLGIGRRLPALPVQDLRGRRLDLGAKPAGKGRVLVTTSSSCPVSRRYAPALARLEKEWTAQGFEFVFVGALAVDPAADLQAMAREAGWQGPVVHDADGTVGRLFALRSTAEALVADAAGTVVYRGAIDDQYGVGYARASARQHPLADALAAVKAGESPTRPATTAPGCVLETAGRTPFPAGDQPVTYHGRIARIVQTHCGECHQAGGIGPFPLATYDDVAGRAAMIRRQVEKGQMPPWFAAPAGTGHSPWANDRSLPEEDRRDLLAWLAGDRPRGAESEAPLPRRARAEWAIGQPDAVFSLPQPVSIPAEGVMPYQKVVVETGFTEDRWVSAMEIQPTARAAVHHVLVFLRPPGGSKGRGGNDAEDEIAGFFGAYVPGNAHQAFPEGFGKWIPAGSSLRFQIHYTPFGKATQDQLRIGFVFAREKPRHRVHVVAIANPTLRIPAGADRHEEYAALPVPRDARLLALLPHMHVRGKAFRYELQHPDGRQETLLDVPRFDFNWQLAYRLAEPRLLPGGSRLRATAWFDNSTGNPANPDPSKPVRWGLQTFEEMMIGYLEYYFPDEGT